MGVQSGFVRKASRYCAFALSLLLASCGGGSPYGGGGGGMGMGSYTIGGMVSGLATGESVVLSLYFYPPNLTVSMNGSYTFPSSVPNGFTYLVTIVTSPMGKTCMVANGTGMVSSMNVTNVNVTC
jgi:hypothetical protein